MKMKTHNALPLFSINSDPTIQEMTTNCHKPQFCNFIQFFVLDFSKKTAP